MASSDWKSLSLGRKIQLYRIHSKLKLKELSSTSQLSLSYLSKLERDKSAPSMKVLEKICSALQIRIDQLLSASPIKSSTDNSDRSDQNNKQSPIPASNLRPILVRKNERKKIRPPRSELYYDLLTPDLQRQLEFTLVHYPPKHESPIYRHVGEESVFCLAGSIRLVIDQEEYILEAGDCVSFDSSIPHRVANHSNEEATVIAVNTPASF
jgi:quercetin dioxygenase-like cupin family protein/DNA-binding Xre family transcriptional regulator